MPLSTALPRWARPPRALFLVFLLAGCGSDAGESSDADVPEAERYGGTLVFGHSADLQSMNAFTASQAEAVEAQQRLLFMPLVQYGADLMPHPWLAEQWDTVRVAPDSIQLTVHLRRDVRWHDGVPTTAADVLFTFETLKDPRTGSPSTDLLDLWSPRAVVIDSFTIRFTLRPHEDYWDVWYGASMMPEHVLGEVPPEEMARHPFGHTSPVGNGPFRFVRRVRGQEWVFEANPDFPEALGGRPYLDRLVVRVVPDATTRLTDFLTGSMDVVIPFPNQVEQIESTPGVTFLTAPARRWVYMGFNTRDPLFRDARVRRAISMALDRQAMVDAILHGEGEVGVSTSGPTHWVYDEEYRRLAIERDVEGARRLLREAGWTPGPDGILVNAEGRRFEFPLLTIHTNDVYRDVGPIAQAQLRPLGIAVEPRGMEANSLFAILDGTPQPGGGRSRDFRAVTSGFAAVFRKDDGPLFHSRAADGPYAETSYSDPRVDLLIDTLNVLMDRGVARRLWQEYHERLLDSSPYAVLFYQNQLLAHRNRVHGVEFDVRGMFAALTRAWIDPAQR